MSIGRNLMVLVCMIVYGTLCFLSGICWAKKPDGDVVLILLAGFLLLPNMFDIINAPSREDEGEPPTKK